jgi:hypothetical protein
VRPKRRLSKSDVLTNVRRLGVETKPGVTKVAVETKLRRLGVETNPGVTRVAVETKLRRLSVETTPETLEMYPRVPNPTVVDVSCGAVTLAAAI